METSTRKVWQPPAVQPLYVPGVACKHMVQVSPGDMLCIGTGEGCYWLQYLRSYGSYTHIVLDTRNQLERVLTEHERWYMTAMLVQKRKKQQA